MLNRKLNDDNCHHCLYLSQRGNNTLHRFNEAVTKAIEVGNMENTSTGTFKLEIVPTSVKTKISSNS